MVRLIFAVANFILLGAFLMVGFFAQREAGRLYADNIIFIAPLYEDTNLHFTPSELENIRINFPNYEIVTSTSVSAVFRGSVMQVRGDIIFTSPGYHNIQLLTLLEGARPQGYTNSVLLSEQLAWRLFGGLNVTGLSVWLGSEPYVVSGVALGSQTGYTAWIHASAAPGMSVSSLYVRLPWHNDADAFGVPRELLANTGRNPNEFAILDINRYVEAIGMRNGIVILLIWFIGIVFAVWKLAELAPRIAARENLQAGVPKTVVAACFVLVAAFVLFSGVNELILLLPNLSLQDVSLVDFVFGWFDMPPFHVVSPAFLRLVELNSRVNLIFFGSLVVILNLLVTLWEYNEVT